MKQAPDSTARPKLKPLAKSLRLITISGCLCMAFVAGTTSPAFVEFMRQIGAMDTHFGLIGGIPMVMLALQLLGAIITNHIHKRKPTFMTLVILGRFLYIPMAVVPALVPSLRGNRGVYFVILLLAITSAIMNVSGPLWLSWMADLIPRRVLNTYWGKRQRWMFATWTVCFLLVAVFALFTALPITVSFPILATVAALAGITDIVLFVWVHEPTNTVIREQPILQTMLAPVHSKEYRPFILFSCLWSASAMFAAAFMQVYALKVLELSVWQSTLVWCVTGVGIALSSPFWGRIADRHGHRPVLTLCIALKSIIVVGFLLITPSSALKHLPWVLFIDSLWNAGLMVASNGYTLKIAPRENRSMFIAAITGLAGICGGLGAILGGLFLDAFSGWSTEFAGRAWGNYHLLFAVNIPARLFCIWLALRIHEPTSTSTDKLLYLMRGTWPARFLLFPVGLYRRVNDRLALTKAAD